MTDHQPTFALQAGGHTEGLTIDSNDSRRIIKKASQREVNFYQSLAIQLDSTSKEPDWSGWRPQFYGCIQSSISHDSHYSIVLENLIASSNNEASGARGLFRHPNVIDIKLGQRLYDDDAAPEKVERMKRSAIETTSAKLGIRITGAQIWDNVQQQYFTIPKSFGKSLDPEGSNLEESFNTLFPVSDLDANISPGGPKLTCSVASLPLSLMRRVIDESLIPQLERLIGHVSSFKWRVYGSSLLFVFEGDAEVAKSVLSSTSHASNIALVKMIDFAHAFEAEDADPGLNQGFETTLKLFKQLSHQLRRASGPST